MESVRDFRVFWVVAVSCSSSGGETLANFVTVCWGNLFAKRDFHAKNTAQVKIWGWNVGVSKNRGTPKWMVYNGKPY